MRVVRQKLAQNGSIEEGKILTPSRPKHISYETIAMYVEEVNSIMKLKPSFHQAALRNVFMTINNAILFYVCFTLRESLQSP